MAQTETVQRTIPYSLDAEQSVIGSMLISKKAIDDARELLKEEDFFNRQLGTIFAAICELDAAGSAVDIVTLSNRLKEKNVPPEVRSAEHLRDLYFKAESFDTILA